MTHHDNSPLITFNQLHSCVARLTVLAMFVSLAVGCSSAKRIVAFVRASQVPPGLQNLTSAPTPAARGPFRVCSDVLYEFQGSDGLRSGLFYVPALSITRDALQRGKDGIRATVDRARDYTERFTDR